MVVYTLNINTRWFLFCSWTRLHNGSCWVWEGRGEIEKEFWQICRW